MPRARIAACALALPLALALAPAAPTSATLGAQVVERRVEGDVRIPAQRLAAADTLCDSTRLRAAAASRQDTLRLVVRSANPAHPTANDRWAASLLATLLPRVRLPEPLEIPTFGGPGTLGVGPAGGERGAVAPVLNDEVRVRVGRDGRLRELVVVTRSLAPGVDEALAQALRDAGEAGLLPAPDGEREEQTAFVALSSTRPAPEEMAAPLRILALPVHPLGAGAYPRAARGPRYPAALRDARVEGRAVVEYVIDAQGAIAPGTPRVVSYTHLDFVRSALDALDGTRFHPALVAGCAVSVWVRQPFEFTFRP